ncbi:pyridoxamine 5'-phosphate oxidase family protein [Demetria terragena]|uniref:pyridoxamine 5'-phosphate oxidase family protein n=1 Tax=Demetria terragena TaxID=63959 RepID=UPI000377C9D1|nr:pyridoxamine 5'-phosphate oxidase family protein [Demetria terragena]
MTDPPRSTARRIVDVRHRLEVDLDLWFASAGDRGPWLVPLSFLLDADGITLLIVTDASTRTGLNLAADGRVRLGLGELRDLAMIDAMAEVVPIDQMTETQRDAFSAKHGSDPRTWADSLILVRMRRIQAWRHSNEHDGRTIMRAGRWVT